MAVQHTPTSQLAIALTVQQAAQPPVQTAAIRDAPRVGAIVVVRADLAAVQIVAVAAVIQPRLESAGRGADF